ncbi:MAG TPA: hypothetical protein VMX75_10510 [Spirochaetia bacterium]|nr:hypothetical protein [Spirochaetia bacterium]
MANVSMEARVARFRDLYARRNTEPLLGFFCGSEFPVFRYKAARSLDPDRDLVPEDFDVDTYARNSEELFELHEECGGDFIYSASAFWGIPWLEAALGCPLRVDHGVGVIEARGYRNFSGPRDIPGFDECSPWIKKTVEFLKAISSMSAGRYPLATTRMRGMADLLAAVYGAERLIFRMMEDPVEVKEVGQRLCDFYIAYGQIQLKHIPLFHGGLGSFYYHMWVPPGTVWHQEDSVSFLSPELYGEFIRPLDEKIFRSFEGNVVHFHSTGGYLPINPVLDMNPTAVELHIDRGGPPAEALFATHMRILEKCPLLIWGEMSDRDLDWLFKNLPPRGLAIQQVVQSPRQAQTLLRRYKSAEGSARGKG